MLAEALFAAALAIMQAAAPSSEGLLRKSADLQTPSPFAGEGGRPAEDLSGITCDPPGTDGVRRCIVIDDQEAHAQIAFLSGGKLEPGPRLQLDKRPRSETLGIARQLNCPGGLGKFGEIDGEGVASGSGSTAGMYFVVGSHGCGRTSGKFKPSSFQLLRFRLKPDGTLAEPAERTYRVVDLLAGSEAAPKLGLDLNSHAGLNIEGLAVSGDRIFFGLRAPGTGGTRSHALILEGSVSSLFAAGHSPLAARPISHPIELGPGRGVRDLARLDDDALLVLTGPETNGDAPYELWIYRPDCLMRAGQLSSHDRPLAGAKAEGVAVIGETAEGVDLVVVYDSVKGGGPQSYRLRRTSTCPTSASSTPPSRP